MKKVTPAQMKLAEAAYKAAQANDGMLTRRIKGVIYAIRAGLLVAFVKHYKPGPGDSRRGLTHYESRYGWYEVTYYTRELHAEMVARKTWNPDTVF